MVKIDDILADKYEPPQPYAAIVAAWCEKHYQGPDQLAALLIAALAGNITTESFVAHDPDVAEHDWVKRQMENT